MLNRQVTWQGSTEVNAVIGGSRNARIDVVAVGDHMLGGVPRTFFFHHWGSGQTEKLAGTVREASDQVQCALK
jgi:hypothetical protein